MGRRHNLSTRQTHLIEDLERGYIVRRTIDSPHPAKRTYTSTNAQDDYIDRYTGQTVESLVVAGLVAVNDGVVVLRKKIDA